MSKPCSGNCLACGKCVNLPVLEAFHAGNQIREPREGYGVAVDIGTTTVVMALVDLATGILLSRHSFLNPQRVYGPDVISRINAANEGKLQDMRGIIIHDTLNGLNLLLRNKDIPPKALREVVVAGNTTMMHLLMGYSCAEIGVSPFKITARLKPSYAFQDVFGGSTISCPVTVLPWFAAFVGGDIMAGLLNVMTMGNRFFLLVDLGTNGEMASYQDGTLIVTSTAAGPAFESAAHGGGASEVVSELASLVRTGVLDETGLINGDTVFTQKQIRDLQLAKSAVRSGIEILMSLTDAPGGVPDAVYLAGGIGQAMNVEDAVQIGLIPRGMAVRAQPVGNASLGGAVRALLAPMQTASDRDALLGHVTEINLAEQKMFNDAFMTYMFF